MFQVDVEDVHGFHRSDGDRTDGVRGPGRRYVFGRDEMLLSTIPKDVGTRSSRRSFVRGATENQEDSEDSLDQEDP